MQIREIIAFRQSMGADACMAVDACMTAGHFCFPGMHPYDRVR